MSMNWENLLNTSRLGNRPPKQEVGRSPFNSDHDKITFCGAFRRLARKTQVHPLATNDHIHNRLTHSLEVACVGRSLGIQVGRKLSENGGLPDAVTPADIGDIVQSTCLAHDIGNPPFGHTGEEAIRSWFASDGKKFLDRMTDSEASDLCSFEGNAQGLRVLSKVENHMNEGGMRLTYATLGSFIKYPWTSQPAKAGKRPKDNKFGVYASELDVFHEVAEAVGLKKCDGDDWYCRHPLVSLMEAADDFCYGILDLEDGLDMNILDWEEIFDVLRPVIPASALPSLKTDLSRVSQGRKIPILRGKVIDAYIESASSAFIKNEKAFLDGDISSLIDVCDKEIKESVEQAKFVARGKIFNHRRKVELEIGSYNVLSTLLNVMCEAAQDWSENSDKMTFKSQRIMTLIGERTFVDTIEKNEGNLSKNYLVFRRVIDFISGMTDNYATFLAKQFNGMGI